MNKIEVFNALRSAQIFIFTIFCCTFSSFTWAQSLIVSFGSANNFLITYPANVISAPPSGMMITFKSNQASSGGVCNLNVNSTGSFPIKKFVTQNPAAGDIQIGHFVTVIFDGAVWHMLSNGSQPLGGISQWTTSGVNIYYSGGNVGIGTSIPGQAMVAVGNSSVSGIGYFGTIIGNNLTGATGSILTVDGFGKLGLGTITGGGGLSGAGQANGIAYYTGASTLTSNSAALSWNGTVMSISGNRFYLFNSGFNSNVVIGNDAGNTAFTGSNNNILGYQAGFTINTGNRNNLFGYQAGNGITTGASNNVLGYQAGFSLGAANYNNIQGYQAGYSANNATAQYNNYFGYSAGYNNVGGAANNYLGYNAGGSYNAGDWNVFIGYNAGFKGGVSTNSGSDNIFIGKNAGSINTTGTQNIAIGSAADFTTGALTNAISIGYSAVANLSNTMILGGTVNPVNVGINTSAPNQRLAIVGNSSVTGIGYFGSIIGNNLNGSPGFIVTVDGAGKLGIGPNVPVGPAGGDLGGGYPNPTVTKLQTYPVSATAPSFGQMLYYNSSWQPASPGGDLSGSYPSPTVVKIQGNSVSTSVPSNGNMLYYNLGSWQNSPPGGDLTGSYPSPTIAAGAITSTKIAASAVNLTSQVTGVLPVGNGGSGTSAVFSLGSIVFAGGSGIYNTDATNFFWDNTSKRLGISTNTPNAQLSIGGPLSGTAISNQFNTLYPGSLPSTVASEYILGSFGFNSGNQSSLAISGYRFQTGSSWTNSALILGMNVDNSLRAGPFIMLAGNGNISVGAYNPASKFEVAGGVAIGSYASTSPAPTNGLIVSGNVGLGTNTPNSTLQVNGSLQVGYTSASSGSYTVLATDCIVQGTTAGSFTFTLPVCNASNIGKVHYLIVQSGPPWTIASTSSVLGTTSVPASSGFVECLCVNGVWYTK